MRLILGKTYCPCSYVGLACPREITLLFFCFDQRTVEEEFCAPEVVFSHRGRGVEAVERPWRCSKGRKLWEAETEVVMRFKRINEGELKKKTTEATHQRDVTIELEVDSEKYNIYIYTYFSGYGL